MTTVARLSRMFGGEVCPEFIVLPTGFSNQNLQCLLLKNIEYIFCLYFLFFFEILSIRFSKLFYWRNKVTVKKKIGSLRKVYIWEIKQYFFSPFFSLHNVFRNYFRGIR